MSQNKWDTLLYICSLQARGGLVHSAHAAHAGVGGHRGFGFLDVAHDALGGQQLGGVDDTALEQVLVVLGAGVEADNFALGRRFSLNILRRYMGKRSHVTQLLKAAWNTNYNCSHF